MKQSTFLDSLTKDFWKIWLLIGSPLRSPFDKDHSIVGLFWGPQYCLHTEKASIPTQILVPSS